MRKSVFRAASSTSGLFAATPQRLGLDQVAEMPSSTPRKPGGIHRGPGKRMVNESEKRQWEFMKMWELTMQGEWDDLEPFKSLPKPKKQFGNEAAEIVWPYALLLQNVASIHPFTKSIYVYYGQKQSSDKGTKRTEVAKRFARQFLVPLSFHNSQCYVETEMLIGYSDAPWVVINCLDGRSLCVPVELSEDKASDNQDVEAGARRLLEDVINKAAELGASVKDPKATQVMYNDRPLQNQYIRVDYQWMGDHAEERMSHLTNWIWDPKDDQLAPKIRNRDASLLTWLNNDGGLPTASSTAVEMHREKAKHRRAKVSQGSRSFYNSGTRQHSTYSKVSGSPKK